MSWLIIIVVRWVFPIKPFIKSCLLMTTSDFIKKPVWITCSFKPVSWRSLGVDLGSLCCHLVYCAFTWRVTLATTVDTNIVVHLLFCRCMAFFCGVWPDLHLVQKYPVSNASLSGPCCHRQSNGLVAYLYFWERLWPHTRSCFGLSTLWALFLTPLGCSLFICWSEIPGMSLLV